MGKLTVENLAKHLDTYKDALILVGDKALNTKEINPDILNNKTLRRKPEEFWNHFFDTCFCSPNADLNEAQKAIAFLKNKGYVKNIINLTHDGKFNRLGDVINLHGTSDMFKCTSCKTMFPYQYVETLPRTNIECELCGKTLRPDILFNGENYFDDKYDAFKHLVLETHTLFIVGLDWGETPIVNLIVDYSEMKDQRNAVNSEQRMVVIVGTDDFLNLEEIGNFEFIVSGDVNESMKRLTNLI